MKKDLFADWLREFCMLVFIQTIQAFMFAIVMTLIISIFSGQFAEENSAAASTGLICVIILASVSKLEDIIKKIFGVKSNLHDSGMRGGLKSLATTMMAANLAKGVTDNFKKVAGGVTGFVGANRNIARQRARMARDINKYGTPAVSAGAGGEAKPALNSPSNDLNSEDYMQKAAEAKSKGDMRGYERNRGIAAGMKKNSTVAASSASSGSGDPSKLQEKMEAYEDKIRELKQKRRASVISGISGGVETVGALAGGISGAAFGAAMGEGKEILQGSLVGMGIGDKAGALATRTLNAPGAIGDLASDIKGWRNANKEFEKEVSSFNSATREAINARNKQIKSVNLAKKKLNDALKDINAGNMDA